jgi:hypothetical protein
MLRDLPTGRLEPVRGALLRLADAAGVEEPLLALAAGTAAVAAVTPTRVILAGEDLARSVAPGAVDLETLTGLDELEPGHFAAVLELVVAAEPGEAPAEEAAVPPDTLDLLRKLADLRDGGVLTDGEFAAKKAELLRRL